MSFTLHLIFICQSVKYLVSSYMNTLYNYVFQLNLKGVELMIVTKEEFKSLNLYEMLCRGINCIKISNDRYEIIRVRDEYKVINSNIGLGIMEEHNIPNYISNKLEFEILK